MATKSYIYLLLMLLLPAQLKTMEIIGAGAAAAAVFSAVMLKRIKSYPSMGSQPKETIESDKKSLKPELDSLIRSDDVWSIVRAYIGEKYQIDIVQQMSQTKYPWSSKSPSPAISALEFSSNDPSNIINAQRFHPWNLKDKDFLKDAKGVVWAKVLHSEHPEAKKNCYLAWAITSTGLAYIHNQCQPFNASTECVCGGCFGSSPLVCSGAKFNYFALEWKACARPEALKKEGIPCFATVDDHTNEKGGKQLTLLMGGDKNDKEIYDLLSLKVPIEMPKGQ
ncbi:MAG TPA: hypothetical protein VFF04_05780 [Candidatus Babeliales bacterium]|nr:hypothetical protein [Candidatus Babeliales bacterium]